MPIPSRIRRFVRSSNLEPHLDSSSFNGFDISMKPFFDPFRSPLWYCLWSLIQLWRYLGISRPANQRVAQYIMPTTFERIVSRPLICTLYSLHLFSRSSFFMAWKLAAHSSSFAFFGYKTIARSLISRSLIFSRWSRLLYQGTDHRSKVDHTTLQGLDVSWFVVWPPCCS